MKIRQHRGTFEDSLKTQQEIEPTHAAVVEVVRAVFAECGWKDLDMETLPIEVRPYGKGPDHIVMVTYPDGTFAPFGFTDGPLIPRHVLDDAVATNQQRSE